MIQVAVSRVPLVTHHFDKAGNTKSLREIGEYRARAYHPGLGRFMSEDPKLFVRRSTLKRLSGESAGLKFSSDAGAEAAPAKWSFEKHPDEAEWNLFRYCQNDPIDFTDPTGLEVPAPDSVDANPSVVLAIAESEAAAAGDVTSATAINFAKNLPVEGAKSGARYLSHFRKAQDAFQKVKELSNKLEKAIGSKAKDPIKREIAKLSDQIKGHLKEMRQKWPGAPQPKTP